MRYGLGVGCWGVGGGLGEEGTCSVQTGEPARGNRNLGEEKAYIQIGFSVSLDSI